LALARRTLILINDFAMTPTKASLSETGLIIGLGQAAAVGTQKAFPTMLCSKGS
jgi:hypothetical protein